MTAMKKMVQYWLLLPIIAVVTLLFSIQSYAVTIPPVLDTATTDSYYIPNHTTVVDKTGTWVFVPGAFDENATTSTKAALVAVTQEHRSDSSITVPAKVTGVVDGVEKEFNVTKIVYGASAQSATAVHVSAPFVSGMSNLTELVFEENPYLTEILHAYRYGTYPNNLNYINVSVSLLAGTQVKELTLPDSLTIIEGNAFANSNLETLNFRPTSSCTLAAQVFANLNSLRSFTVTKNMALVDQTFANSYLVDGVTFENDCTLSILPNSCFYNSKVGEVTLCDSISTIGELAFGSTPNLVISDWKNVRVLNNNAFHSSGIEVVDMSGSKIETIADGQQSSRITDGVFRNTTKLRTVKLSPELSHLGSYVFCSSSVTTVDMSLCTDLQSVGDSAFNACQSLTSVTLAPNLTRIEASSFYRCTVLPEIDIPDSVTVIGEKAFSECTSLSTVGFPSSIQTIEAHAFSLSGLESAVINHTSVDNSVLILGDYVFYRCPKLKSIEITGNLVTVPAHFADIFNYGSSVLTSVKLPDTVTTYGNYAFDCCNALTDFKFSANTKSIGSTAFRNCISLQSVRLPDTLTDIGTSCFIGCTSLVTFEIAEDAPITTIEASVLSGATNLQYVYLSNNLTSIGAEVFNNCTNLTEIVFPDSITTFGNKVLYNCQKLVSCELPANLSAIPASALQNCKSLTSIDIPDAVTSIGASAFQGCPALQTVNVSKRSDLVFIDTSAFQNCSSLATFYCPDTLASIGNYAFAGTGFTTFTLGKNVNFLGVNVFSNCSNLRTFVFTGEKLTFIPDQAFAHCTNLNTIELPSSIKTIGIESFLACNLGNFMYGGNETAIGTSAFYNSGITYEDFPETLTSIGNNAYFNTRLVNVTIPASVTTVGTQAFYNISTLETLDFEDGTEIKSIPTNFVGDSGTFKAVVTMPSSITTLAANTFGTVHKVVFEDAYVTSIGTGVFTNGVDIVENFPAHQDTIQNLAGLSHQHYVESFSFNPTSTVTKLANSLCFVNTRIDFPESLKMWYTTATTDGVFNGASLDLKNIEFVGMYQSADNKVNLDNASLHSPIAYARNLTNENFSGEKLIFLNGLWYTNGTINYREKSPDLKYFNGGYDSSDFDMRTWLPDGMSIVQSACNDAYTNVNNILYLPNASVFNAHPKGNTPYIATFVTHENTTWFGSVPDISKSNVQSTASERARFNIVIPSKNNLLSLSDIYGYASVATPTGTIYVSDDTTYNNLVAEQEALSDVRGYEMYRNNLKILKRMSDISAVCTSTPDGIQINATLNADAPQIQGSLKIYNVSGDGNDMLITSVPVDTANAVAYVDDVDMSNGVNTFKLEFVSDLITTMNSSAQVTYSKNAVPTAITTETVLMDDGKSTTLTATIGVSDTASDEQKAKLPKGELKLYWVDDNNNDVFVKSQTVTDNTNNVVTAIIDAESAYVRSGVNNYKIVFESVDIDTYMNAYATESVTYDGADVGLTGVLTDYKGGLNCNISIDATALNYGTLTLYLGDNQLGTVLNSNNGTDVFISPDKIKSGTVYVLAEYKSNSARYTSDIALLEYQYNPVVTELTITTSVDDDDENVIVNGAVDNVASGNYDGTLKLYYVTDSGETLLKDTTDTSMAVSVPKTSLNKGMNVFRFEWVPNTIETSYASAIAEHRVAGTNVALIGATTNMGDRISISVKPVVNGQAIDPSKIRIWQGASEFGRELTTEIDSSGEIAVAYVPKTDLFVGTNVFFADYVDDTNEYESDGLTLYFGMAVDGSESTSGSDNDMGEKLQQIIDALIDLSDTLDIDFNLLIKTINDNFAVIDTDLQSIKDAILELTKNKPIDYTENFNSIVEALKELNITSGGTGSNEEIEALLTTIANNMSENNEYYTQIVDALAKLDELEDISTELENIKTEIANGNNISTEMLDKLDKISEALNTAFDTSDLEALFSEILAVLEESVSNGDDINSSLGDISDRLDNISNSLQNNENTWNNIDDSLTNIDGSLSDIEDSLTNIDTTIKDSTANIIESIDKLTQTNDIQGIIDAILSLKENMNGNGGGSQADLTNIENILRELVEQSGQQNIVIDTSSLEDILKEIVEQGNNTNLDTSGIENALADLKTVIGDNINQSLNDIKNELSNNFISSADVDKIVAAIEKAGGNNNVDPEILNELRNIANSLKNMNTNNNNNNNGGITDAGVDKIVDAIQNIDKSDDDTQKLIDAILQSNKNNTTNNQNDLKNIEAILKQLTEKSGSDTIVFDTTALEELVQALIEDNKKNNTNLDTSGIENALADLKSVMSTNKSQMEGVLVNLEKVVGELSSLAQTNNGNNNYDNSELIDALNRIGTMLDTANQNGVSGQQLIEISEGLVDIRKAIEAGTITSDDITRIIAAIDNIKLENSTDPRVLDSLSSIAATLKSLESNQSSMFGNMSNMILIVGFMISAAIVAGFILMRVTLKKNSENQTEARVVAITGKKPQNDDSKTDSDDDSNETSDDLSSSPDDTLADRLGIK